MPLGLNLVFTGDSRGAVAAIGAMETAATNASKVLQKEITQKMKMIFSATAIEEAVRRTGEWAQQLTQAAQAMGVTNEVLQTLNILAAKTNTPKEAVLSMFEAIDKARNEAIKGNTEMTVSFQRLGVTLEDLKGKTKSELFGLVMGKIPSGISGQGSMLRQSVQDITGNAPEMYIESIRSGLGAGGFGGFKAGQMAEGAVLPEGTVDMLSKTWGEFMVDLIQVGNELKPLAIVFIVLIRTLTNALGGFVSAFKGVWDLVIGTLSGDRSQILNGAKAFGGLLTGLFSGLFKIVTSVVDMLSKGFMGLLKTVGIGKGGGLDTTKFVDALFKPAKDLYGEKGIKGGEAITDIAAIALSGGEAALGKAGASMALKGAGYAEKLGMPKLSSKLLDRAFGLERIGRGEIGFGGGDTVESILAQTSMDFTIARFEKEIMAAKKAGMSSDELLMSNVALRKAVAGTVAGARRTMGIGAATGATAAAYSAAQTFTGTQRTGAEALPIIPPTVGFGSAGGGDTSMLKIGGVMGSNFQSRMVALNTEMVKLLAQISTNTQGAANASKYNQPSQGTQFGGGY